MKSIIYNSLSYYAIRILTFPISLMSYSMIHRLGRVLGTIAYWSGPKKRKKITFNNLALAKDLNFSEKEIKKIAKESYQNLIINSLEYFRLKNSQGKMHLFVKGNNTDPLFDLPSKGQGVICVTGHISNWELCFLTHTQQGLATAIGKKIKNLKLYQFIQSVRQMHGGQIIDMKNAISFAVKNLKEGAVFSMVNDQAYTSSSYSYPFFGARAWTSAAPALMSYRSGAPLISVKTKRLKHGKYEYTLSDPIWPDRTKPLKEEVKRLMDRLMSDFEKMIAENPGQWLWQHKRWKQEGFNLIWEKFKADSILFILPEDEQEFDWINKGLWVIPQVYPKTFLTFMSPKKYLDQIPLKNYEVIPYKNPNDIFIRDYRFQLIFDFTNNLKIRRHFLKLGAHTYYSLEDIKKESRHINPRHQKFEDMFSSEAVFQPPTV